MSITAYLRGYDILADVGNWFKRDELMREQIRDEFRVGGSGAVPGHFVL